MSEFCILGDDCDAFNPRTRLPGLADSVALCRVCAARSSTDINLLRYDYLDLSQIIAPGGSTSDVNIRRPKPASRPPINLGVYTLRDDIDWQLQIWGYRVQELTLPTGSAWRPSYVRQGYRVDWWARYLSQRVDALAGLPEDWTYAHGVDAEPTRVAGADGLLALRALHRKVRNVLGLNPRKVALPGECPDRICKGRSLCKVDGSDVVTCEKCGGQWSYEDYQRYVTLVVTEIAPVTDDDTSR